MAKSDRLKAKIAELEKELREQLEKEQAARKRKIGRLAERTGLVRLDISADVLEAAFREIVEKHGGAANDENADAGADDDSSDDENAGTDDKPRLRGFGAFNAGGE